MKELIEKLDFHNQQILNLEVAIQVTEASTYYSVFGTEAERQRDLTEQRKALKYALSLKSTTLQSLQIAINWQLIEISNTSRTLTLKSA